MKYMYLFSIGRPTIRITREDTCASSSVHSATTDGASIEPTSESQNLIQPDPPSQVSSRGSRSQVESPMQSTRVEMGSPMRVRIKMIMMMMMMIIIVMLIIMIITIMIITVMIVIIKIIIIIMMIIMMIIIVMIIIMMIMIRIIVIMIMMVKVIIMII